MKILSSLLWFTGLAELIALFLWPTVGLHAFWNVLIPAAPALFAVAPGVWRNICPLGTTGQLPRKIGMSGRTELTSAQSRRLQGIGVVLLLAIVPLRHVVLNLDGPATATAMIVLALLAIGMGLKAPGKSGWCTGLCPVHPVEKLYGIKPAVHFQNHHCQPCVKCTPLCPDTHSPTSHNAFVGGFAGYIYGWFQVPDWADGVGWSHLPTAYAWPLGGFLAGWLLYRLLQSLLPKENQRKQLLLAFSAAAISCYYWFRLPALFGYGPFPGDGMLIDLRDTLPAWFPVVTPYLTTLFFFAWFFRRAPHRTWMKPQFLL